MHQKVLKIENENAEGHLYVNHTVINLQAHRDKVTKRRKHYFFLGFAPPNTISRPGRSQTCCQRNFQINALRFSHSSWSRQVCVKNRYFYKIGRKKKFKKIKFYFSLKLYRLSQCRIFVVDDDNVTKLSQLTPYELNLQRKRNIMVRKFSNFLKNIRAHLANIIHGYDWSKADGTAVSNIGHISFLIKVMICHVYKTYQPADCIF